MSAELLSSEHTLDRRTALRRSAAAIGLGFLDIGLSNLYDARHVTPEQAPEAVLPPVPSKDLPESPMQEPHFQAEQAAKLQALEVKRESQQTMYDAQAENERSNDLRKGVIFTGLGVATEGGVLYERRAVVKRALRSVLHSLQK